MDVEEGHDQEGTVTGVELIGPLDVMEGTHNVEMSQLDTLGSGGGARSMHIHG